MISFNTCPKLLECLIFGYKFNLNPPIPRTSIYLNFVTIDRKIHDRGSEKRQKKNEQPYVHLVTANGTKVAISANYGTYTN